MVFIKELCNFFYELCDRMRFEVNCAKSHHRIISDGLCFGQKQLMPALSDQGQFPHSILRPYYIFQILKTIALHLVVK